MVHVIPRFLNAGLQFFISVWGSGLNPLLEGEQGIAVPFHYLGTDHPMSAYGDYTCWQNLTFFLFFTLSRFGRGIAIQSKQRKGG